MVSHKVTNLQSMVESMGANRTWALTLYSCGQRGGGVRASSIGHNDVLKSGVVIGVVMVPDENMFGVVDVVVDDVAMDDSVDELLGASSVGELVVVDNTIDSASEGSDELL